ncbi:hypothetical protein OSB94_20625, partial [Proteus vulgaris]|uniref:hypothetical protein n=1 Tax=Proteus vulgaris TaxID=585 RepID=UPI002876C1DB
NPYVTGSSPVGGAKFREARAIIVRAFCFLTFYFLLWFYLSLFLQVVSIAFYNLMTNKNTRFHVFHFT